MGAAWLSGLEASAGLLIVCVAAAASLAEDRARGSLDLLLTTRLSTGQIVLGKWLGACRVLPFVAMLPAIVTFAFVVDRPSLWGPILLLIGFVLCAGAAIAAAGLAAAVWLTRPAWTIGVAVSMYVIGTVGWCALAMMIDPGRRQSEGLAMASTFFGPGTLTIHITDQTADYLAWGILWMIGYAIITPALLIATIMSFDRLMGRVEGPFLWLMCGGYTRRERLIAAAFFTIATLLTLDATFAGSAAYLFNPASFTGGLFLAAIAAAISSARGMERGEIQRAALCGLSPSRIVLAKWLGAYRLVVPVVFLATLVAIGTWQPQNSVPLELCLVPAYLLGAGAAWCSVGVVMGMRFPCARAAILTAAVCGLSNVVGPFLFSTIGSGWLAHIDLWGSPTLTMAALTDALAEWNRASSAVLVSANVWIVVYTVVAVVLLLVAVLGVRRRLASAATGAVPRAGRPALRGLT
jgi:ABC-type transport system involved in multi-copper enzyme maturation permease subunit